MGNPTDHSIEPLTTRELDVLHLLAEDCSNREIAAQLFVSVGTVKWHNNQIYGKLGVTNRTEAVTRARTLGLIEKDPAALPPNNLPAQTTRFIGRTTEVADLTALVADPAQRLVTVLAPGGMGKTRLALAVAERQLDAFRDGVFYVPLAALTHAEHIVSAIAEHTGYDFQSDSRAPRQQILDFLRDQQLLLLLDNYEHLLADAALVTAMLEAAPKVTALVTSRERLQLRGETVYSLGGMTVPPNDPHVDVRRYDAVRMFVETAQRISPDFIVSEDNLLGIVNICRLVDGMPLGIELAAGWADVLPIEEIANEIAQNLDFLQTAMRDIPDRMRSTRAVFEAAWGRLTPVEQDAFMKLAVFRGGCSRQAVQAITGADLQTINALTNKALLRLNSQERYETHELLRQYAEEQLILSGQSDKVRSAHSAYYGAAMQEREPMFKGSGQVQALDDIEIDFENVRTGWEYAVKQGDYAILDQYAVCLARFSEMRSRLQEGEALFTMAIERLRALPGASHKAVLGRMLNRLGMVLLRFGSSRIEQAITLTKEAMTIAQAREDPADIIACLDGLILMCARSNAPASQLANMARERVALCREHGTREMLANALSTMSIFTRGFEQANEGQTMVREGLAIYREIDNRYGIAIATANLGSYAMQLGACQEALDYYEESLTVCMEDGHLARAARRMGWLASIHLLMGNLTSSQSYLKQSSALARECNDPWARAVVMTQRGLQTCLVEEDYTRGLQLVEESIALGTSYQSDACDDTWTLALACCGLEDWPATKQHCLTGLRLALDLPYVLVMVGCLAVAAIVMAHEGNAEKAIEWLALAHTYPTDGTGWMQHWKMLERTRPELEQALGSTAYEAAWKRGSTLDLVATVQDILSNGME